MLFFFNSAAAAKTCIYSDQDIAKIIQIVEKANERWFEIGVNLKISIPRLKVVKKHNQESSLNCFKAIIKEWLKRGPELGLLVEVLKQQNFADIAEELQGQLSKELVTLQ